MSLFQFVEVATMSINEFNNSTKKRIIQNDSVMIENEMNLHEDNKPHESNDKQAIKQPKKAKRGRKKVKCKPTKKKNLSQVLLWRILLSKLVILVRSVYKIPMTMRI